MNAFERINFIIGELNCSKYEFAKAINCTPESLYNIESGRTKSISSTLARKIREVFPQYNYQWLITGEGEPHDNDKLTQFVTYSHHVIQTGNVTENSAIQQKLLEELEAQRKLTEKAQEQADRLLALLEKMNMKE